MKGRLAVMALLTMSALIGGVLAGVVFGPGTPMQQESVERRVAALEAASQVQRGEALDRPVDRGGPGGAQSPIDQRLDRVEANLARWPDPVDGRTPMRQEMKADDPARDPPADPDVASLQAASDADLRTELSRLYERAFGSPTSILDADLLVLACEALLLRGLGPTERAETLLTKGRAHMVLKDPQRTEEAYRAAIETVGEGSSLGRVTAWQLALVVTHRDPLGAAAILDRAAAQPDSSVHERSFYPFVAGNCLAAGGDPAGARAHFNQVIEEFGAMDDPNAKANVKRCRAALAGLDGSSAEGATRERGRGPPRR